MYSEKPRLHERQKTHKEGALRTVALDVTPLCNMACPHCYAEPFVNKVAGVSLDVLRRATDELYEMGVFHYVLQGGEPIVDRERLAPIIDMIRPDETFITVVSNGWSITPEAARWLREHKVDKLSLSMDSGFEEEHDRGRKPGSFQRVLRAVAAAKAEGLFASLSTVVTHQNLRTRSFERVIEIAAELQVRVDVQIAEPVGQWEGRRDVLFTPDDTRYLEELAARLPTLSSGEPALKRDLWRRGAPRCPAGTDFLAISPQGDVLPCNFVQLSLGNVARGSIREMRDRLLSSRWFNGSMGRCPVGEDPGYYEECLAPHVGTAKPLDAATVLKIPPRP